MSKASEWVRSYDARPKIIVSFLDEDTPKLCTGFGCVNTLEVSPNGNLAFHQARTLMRETNSYGFRSAPEKVYYRPDEALKLARWIIDTFGDDKCI